MSNQETLKAELIKNKMKNKAVGIGLNFFFPGAGHIYAGSVLAGILIFVAMLVCALTSVFIVPGIVGFGLWIWSMVNVNSKIIAHNEKMLKDGLTESEPTAEAEQA